MNQEDPQVIPPRVNPLEQLINSIVARLNRLEYVQEQFADKIMTNMMGISAISNALEKLEVVTADDLNIELTQIIDDVKKEADRIAQEIDIVTKEEQEEKKEKEELLDGIKIA